MNKRNGVMADWVDTSNFQYVVIQWIFLRVPLIFWHDLSGWRSERIPNKLGDATVHETSSFLTFSSSPPL